MHEDRLSAVWQRFSLSLKVLNQFLQTASALLQILTGLGIILAVVTFVYQNWTVFAVTLVFTVGLLVSFTLLYRSVIQITAPVTDLYWVDATYTYTIDSNEVDSKQSIEITLQALRDGVDRFTNKYLWSGKGEVTTEVLTKGHRLVGPPVFWEGWYYYEVFLGRHLRAGEKERVIIRQTMKDIEKTSEPSLSKTVTEPLGHLILRVVLPKPSERVTFHEYYSYFMMHPVQSQVVPFDKTKGEIVWEIDAPKPHHKYSIRWEY